MTKTLTPSGILLTTLDSLVQGLSYISFNAILFGHFFANLKSQGITGCFGIWNGEQSKGIEN
jgi:hypothetical protein